MNLKCSPGKKCMINGSMLTHWNYEFHVVNVESVGLTASNGMGSSPKPCSISRLNRGCQPTDGCGPLSHCTYIKGGRGRGTDDKVHRDLTLSPTSLFGPITKAQQRREASTLRYHCSGSPALTGSSVVHLSWVDASQICFHFTNENLYVGSNDVELIRQALWWDTLTIRD
jgi:hypothetical protein